MSQDVIALESVCLDWMRSEPSNSLNVHGNVDNWLHEAAQADDPPSGMVYNPGAEEAPLESLGVHEHFDGWGTKQYSRNLGTGEGIELYTVNLSVGINDRTETGTGICLNPLYPNPFAGVTTIPFTLDKETGVKIAVFDQLGRIVVNLVDEKYQSGNHTVQWDASGQAAGIYFCRMRTEDGQVRTREIQIIP